MCSKKIFPLYGENILKGELIADAEKIDLSEIYFYTVFTCTMYGYVDMNMEGQHQTVVSRMLLYSALPSRFESSSVQTQVQSHGILHWLGMSG